MASPASRRPDPRPVPSPSNPVLLARQSQWFFTDEELTRTPSQLDGMKLEAEHMSRFKGVNFITQVGIMLKLPQLTIATAAVFLHRFFMRFSMVDLPSRPGMHPYAVAATSLFLATKVEENVRRMRELVVACCRVGQKQPNLLVDEQSKDFWKWRDTILHNEDLLLESLCFDLQLEQPYRLLYDFICFFALNENKSLRNASWAFVNDSMFTVLCLQFPARTIGAAALYAALRHCDISIADDDLGRPWWEQIDVDLGEMRSACSRLAQLYENNSMQRHNQNYSTTPASDDGADKTRRPRSGTPAATSAGTPSPAGLSQETGTNGRKRSREPEVSGGPSESRNPPPVNGQRSPKRQRLSPHDSMESKSTAADTPASQPSASISQASHATAATSERPSSQDRHMNGHPPPPHSRHTLPRVPQQYQQNRSFNRRNSHENAPKQLDPVQQRIDQIVHQNASTKDSYKNPKYDRGRSPDHYGPRDQHRERRSSSPGSGRSRKHSLDEKQRPPRPPSRDYVPPLSQPAPPSQQPPSPPPPEDEEVGGSEEGELV